MWRQNELWRNVHEAQFEHMRKIYKRQWLEAFRVNADEYIYKYNITKAAQYAEWEHEMQQQEAKRREAQHMDQGRRSLKAKHMDLLREYHERHFFYWYERASERLQYMTLIPYVSEDNIKAHIEAELDKYVAGKDAPYPLNFAGQMPLLEDASGSIVQAHESVATRHAAENPAAPGAIFEPRSLQDDAQAMMRETISAAETELEGLGEDGALLAKAVDDVSSAEVENLENQKVARSAEETEDDRSVSRQKYISRGQIGSKSVLRKPKPFESESPSPPPSTPRLRRQKGVQSTASANVKIGEVAARGFAKTVKERKKEAFESLSESDIKQMTDMDISLKSEKSFKIQETLSKTRKIGKYKEDKKSPAK
jgi:hypothetical protein